MTARFLISVAGVVSFATLAGALAFQFIGGLPPCTLCYWQRYAHLAVMAAAALALALPHRLTLALGGLAGLVSAGVAGFHSGVEREWWPGLSSCSAVSEDLGALDAGSLLAVDSAPAIIRCDEIAWTLAGLSMANYNVLVSLGLAALFGLAMVRLTDR